MIGIRNRHFKYALTFLVLLNVFIYYPFIHREIKVKNDLFEITFLDVGQGDSILIKTPGGRYGLIDAGKGDVVIDRLSETLPYYINTLDFVVMTHPDADHIEGFTKVLEKYNVETAFIHKVDKDSPIYAEVIGLLNDKNIPNYQITDDNDFTLDGVKFDTVWPMDTESLTAFEDPNDTSISFLITYKDFQMYTAGDLSFEFEEEILNNISTYISFEATSLDVLKASHHGSNTSTSLNLTKAMTPTISIISAGKNNSYGHPNEEVLSNLEQVDSIVYSTIEDNNIRISTDGETMIVNQKDKYEV